MTSRYNSEDNASVSDPGSLLISFRDSKNAAQVLLLIMEAFFYQPKTVRV